MQFVSFLCILRVTGLSFGRDSWSDRRVRTADGVIRHRREAARGQSECGPAPAACSHNATGEQLASVDSHQERFRRSCRSQESDLILLLFIVVIRRVSDLEARCWKSWSLDRLNPFTDNRGQITCSRKPSGLIRTCHTIGGRGGFPAGAVKGLRHHGRFLDFPLFQIT